MLRKRYQQRDERGKERGREKKTRERGDRIGEIKIEN